MRKGLVVLLLFFGTLGFAASGIGQNVDPQACGQTLQTNCTRCHSLKRVCDKLNQANADWKGIVTTMGQRGKLSQEVQDAVVVCLTKSSDPKKLVCGK